MRIHIHQIDVSNHQIIYENTKYFNRDFQLENFLLRTEGWDAKSFSSWSSKEDETIIELKGGIEILPLSSIFEPPLDITWFFRFLIAKSFHRVLSLRWFTLLQKTKTITLLSLALLKKRLPWRSCLVRYTKMLVLVYHGASISIIELYKFKDVGTYFKYHCIHISIGILNVEERHVLSYIVCNIFSIPSIWFVAPAKRHISHSYKP